VGRPVGDRRPIRRRDRTVPAVKHGLKLRHLLERAIAPNTIVLRHDRLSRPGGEPRDDLGRESAVVGAPGGELVAAKGPAVLRFPADVVLLGISADCPID
jgi:hypothetical protein